MDNIVVSSNNDFNPVIPIIRKRKLKVNRTKENNSGWPIELFIQEPSEDFMCPICLNVLKVPYQCSRGHTFCELCIKKCIQKRNISLSSSDNNCGHSQCPQCRVPIVKNELQINLVVRNLINNFKVQCWNHLQLLKDGSVDDTGTGTGSHSNNTSSSNICNWQGKLCDLETHLRNDCPLSIILCSNIGCEYKSNRNTLNSEHISICQYQLIPCKASGCSEKYALKDEAHHLNICRFYQLKCPNNCGMEPVKSNDEIQNHINLYCPLQPVLCPIYQLTNSSLCHNSTTTTSSSSLSSVSICGCQYDGKILRQDVENHINNPKTILVCLNELSSQKQILTHLELENQYLRNQLNFNNNV